VSTFLLYVVLFLFLAVVMALGVIQRRLSSLESINCSTRLRLIEKGGEAYNKSWGHVLPPRKRGNTYDGSPNTLMQVSTHDLAEEVGKLQTDINLIARHLKVHFSGPETIEQPRSLELND
jgi:HAMP domain-containing protein